MGEWRACWWATIPPAPCPARRPQGIAPTNPAGDVPTEGAHKGAPLRILWGTFLRRAPTRDRPYGSCGGRSYGGRPQGIAPTDPAGDAPTEGAHKGSPLRMLRGTPVRFLPGDARTGAASSPFRGGRLRWGSSRASYLYVVVSNARGFRTGVRRVGIGRGSR